MAIPDFGSKTEYHNGTELVCKFCAPGITLHDLTMLFEKASNSDGANSFSGNPNDWPEVRGLAAVTQAILEAIYGKD